MNSISFAITVCNEHLELDRLLNQLLKIKRNEDEIIIQMDTQKVTNEVRDVISKHRILGYEYPLNNDFASFKNNLKGLCSKDYMFQIDADELLSENLINNLHEIIQNNLGFDAIAIPRINILVEESILLECINDNSFIMNTEYWRNYPDHQIRLLKNKPEIKWIRPVHETLTSLKSVVQLNKGYDLLHIKSFERQNIQDKFYSSNFSSDLL